MGHFLHAPLILHEPLMQNRHAAFALLVCHLKCVLDPLCNRPCSTDLQTRPVLR